MRGSFDACGSQQHRRYGWLHQVAAVALLTPELVKQKERSWAERSMMKQIMVRANCRLPRFVQYQLCSSLSADKIRYCCLDGWDWPECSASGYSLANNELSCNLHVMCCLSISRCLCLQAYISNTVQLLAGTTVLAAVA
jgi:hypothetical protein